MYYIQIPKQIVSIDSYKPKSKTTATTATQAVRETPPDPGFRSMLASLQRSLVTTDVVQQNTSNTSDKKEQQTGIDDASKEKQANLMGAKALQTRIQQVNPHNSALKTVQCYNFDTPFEKPLIKLEKELKNSLNPFKDNHLNVVGEDSTKSKDRRNQEKEYVNKYTGSSNY